MTSTPNQTEYHPWALFMAAREEALRVGERRIGTDFVLLALLRDQEVEELLHVSQNDVRRQMVSLDNSALTAVGLPAVVEVRDFDAEPMPPRPKIRELLTQGMRMSPAAKASLEQAYDKRRARVTSRGVLLALLENREPDPAITLLRALGVDVAKLRAQLESDPTTTIN